MGQEQIHEEDFEIEEEKTVFKEVLSWFFKNIKFLLIPGSRIDELTYQEIEYEKLRSKRKFIRRFKSFLTILGIILIFTIVSFAVLAPWISPGTFDEANGIFYNEWGPPSPVNPLGQTKFGRDVLTRLIWGARSSLTIALPAITFSVFFGVIIGVISAYYGGWVDSIIMRIMDVFLAFPGLILAMVFIAIWGQEIQYIMLAWGILGIPYYSRLIRGNVLQARRLPYIEAAKVSGAGDGRIMFKHILPNVIQPIIISFTFDIGGIILSLAGLAFLGFSDPRMIEWGNDISIARAFLYNAPWASMWPGFIILLTVLGFMLVGDGLRDALDPKLKNL
ncbi:MAG: ABC transporter permease [Candidatus Lokiarchaeota archaeon]|nr:ABC transporter permease [Candidatus Lokiarchaeota archaeon]